MTVYVVTVVEYSSDNNGGGLLPILAVAMPEHTERLEHTSDTAIRPSVPSIFRREFNRNPRVADYESAKEVMELFLNER